MNRLVIIGNGFDMAHGLKTSYMDFINWYWDGRVDEFLSKSSKNPPQHFDGSILVQKALSAIKCCNEEIGFAIAVDVLKGNFSP